MTIRMERQAQASAHNKMITKKIEAKAAKSPAQM